MIAYRVYYIDDGDSEYYLKEETAFQNAAEYIYNILFEDGQPDSEIEDVIAEFNRTGFAPELCSVDEIVVDER